MSTSKSTLALGQILFDFGAGPVATTMAAARAFNRSQNIAGYAQRKQDIRQLVEEAVNAAVDQADIAFSLTMADSVASEADLDEHEKNLSAIKAKVAKATYLTNGYGTCGSDGCPRLTTPRKSGIPYEYCIPHSGRSA